MFKFENSSLLEQATYILNIFEYYLLRREDIYKNYDGPPPLPVTTASCRN